MFHEMRMKMSLRRCRFVAAVALLLIALGAMFYTGFAGDIARALMYRLPSGGGFGAAPIYHGPASLEERVLEADVIARVRLFSVSPVAEAYVSQIYLDTDEDREWVEDKAYFSAMELKLEVLEYLQGDGGDEIIAVVTHDWMAYETELGARAFSHDLTDTRDTIWDDREAIVFLKKSVVYPKEYPQILSLERPDRYFLGFVGDYGYVGNDYTIDSHRSKRWLPSAGGVEDIGKVASQASSGNDNRGERRFLTGAERSENDSYTELTNYRVSINAYNQALGSGGDSSTLTLSQLKEFIAEMEEEVAEGGGSEEYRKCVYEKYKWNREVEYLHSVSEFGYRTESHDHELASGSPADTVFADGWLPFQPPDNYDPTNHEYANPNFEWEGWIEGRDAHLFYVANNKSVIVTARPFPEGEYRFYYNDRDAKYVLCDAYPDLLRTRRELVVDVSAPAGTLHEAFFDPVTLGDAVGAADDSGVLKPASFAFVGSDTTIQRIDWLDGQARMALSPHSALPDHHIDFIALDGSVALRLDFDDAVEVQDADGGQSLVWGVCEQPWVDGDLLMLRIAEGTPDDGVAAVNDEECLAATPEIISEPSAVPTQ